MSGLAEELGVGSRRQDPVTTGVLKLLGVPPVAWVLARTLRHIDRLALRVTGGRYCVSDLFLPTLFLTTKGRRTGQPRTSQLVAIPIDGGLAVIGSNFGQDHHPAWVHNALADPHATVAYKDRSAPVEVHEVTGAEADRIWATGVACYPGFASYRTATDRQIKIFRLERPR